MIEPRKISVIIASARGVAEAWRRQYQRDGKWADTVKGSSRATYRKLCALGKRPGIAQVAKVIGNKSWSYLTCAGCRAHIVRAVQIGESWDTSAPLFCECCLDEALTAIRTKPRGRA
jgi:hypothetical protein